MRWIIRGWPGSALAEQSATRLEVNLESQFNHCWIHITIVCSDQLDSRETY